MDDDDDDQEQSPDLIINEDGEIDQNSIENEEVTSMKEKKEETKSNSAGSGLNTANT